MKIPAALKQFSHWPTLVGLLVLIGGLTLLLRADLRHRQWVEELSRQGSASPELAANSPTGYMLGQRQFLGTHERGETYRWIAYVQQLQSDGALSAAPYDADTVPVGRPQLLPRLYAWWLAGVARVGQWLGDETPGRAAEWAARWEPVIAHVLTFLAAAWFMGRRFGLAGAAIGGLFVAVFPPLCGQFIPGVLTPRTGALLLATGALALHLTPRAPGGRPAGFGVVGALLAAGALWLEPAIGFPTVLIGAVLGLALSRWGDSPLLLRWALVGASATLLAWGLDRSPWSPAAGELRYVHPLYAGAWLGLGLLLDGLRRSGSRRWLMIGAGAALAGSLIGVQIARGFSGWWFAGGAMRRLTSLDETVAYTSALDWLGRASGWESVLVVVPWLGALAAVLWWPRASKGESTADRSWQVTAAILLLGVALMMFFRVRWGVVVSLVALPAIWQRMPVKPTPRRWVALTLCGVLLGGLALGQSGLPKTLRRPISETDFAPADFEAMVNRHFAHWLASRHPGQRLAVLAPPELSDAIVFHGGGRVLLSTAWESYPGQVAASRILSALEATEAEAVIQSRELTHVILTSWDPVLPVLVQDPKSPDKDTLYARLQRWVMPPYLRPMPYRLPPIPAYAESKLVVFKVTAPQDEGLALSRLAEYFVEMDRPEPAGLAAKVLADAYADDPNAAVARALVYAQAKNRAGLDVEVARLAADLANELPASSWDRRVQRAIVLALGRRNDLARTEVAACAETATREDLFELTPLQAYRFRMLLERLQVEFADRALTADLQALSAGFATARP